jgi:copper oxidase (laccase) domain-containing protein
VGPEVFERLTGERIAVSRAADLRDLLATQARAAGLPATRISVSAWCTRCHNDRFFSHRAGDAGRQVGVICGGA